MFTCLLERKHWLSVFVATSLFLAGLLPPTTFAWDKDRKPIVVSFGQPNIWSLEQAHYLLARMHMTNLDLQAKQLTDKELDPNITHATRIQILKQLLQIGAEFNQGIGFQNRRIVENAEFNDNRRREVTTRRSSLQDESLKLTRQISALEDERARMDTDPSATEESKKLKDTEIRNKRQELAAVKEQISQDTDELKTLTADASATPTSPTPIPSPMQLPSSALESLIQKNAEKLLEAAKDPKLNATTMLDNTVQLQYEIIAKQLTLLRDEVGAGERLVFLELPQSIYTTPGDGDEKMAQTWWHVNGYTRTDPLVRLLLELYEVEQKWYKIQEVPAFENAEAKIGHLKCTLPDRNRIEDLYEDDRGNRQLAAMYHDLKCERENARDATLAKLFREANNLFSRVEQSGARDTSETVEAIRRLVGRQRNEVKDVEGKRVDVVVDTKPTPGITAQSQTDEATRRKKINDIKEELLKILSKPPSAGTAKELNDLGAKLNLGDNPFERGMEFIRLDEETVRGFGARDIERHTVRAVDIIPRQSSLNVNDIQNTVKATGILAAFKFLFGFAGQVNFQRQREQFEQFLHQELYASGFGKGNRDFGWTFGALPGTKRVAPGVRTTFAALVVPQDAESIVMSARGCYFPRKNYQPLDFQDTAHDDWDRTSRFKRYNCSDEQSYILAIPGGGEASNFWVTNVDYQDGQNGGQFVTVSVRGKNFSSQMGVLVDGVPLFATVGLAQPHLMPRKVVPEGQPQQLLSDGCTNAQGICGRYERIDSEQIVFSFKMPTNYVGTPTITLIAPGKAVDLNSIPRLRINREANLNLRNEAAFMFGTRPVSIADLQFLNVPQIGANVTALLTGTGFDRFKDRLYLNGVDLRVVPRRADFRSATLYELQFSLPASDTLKVTLVRDKEIVTKSFSNPAALTIASASVASFEPATNGRPAALVVRLRGTGFTSPPRLRANLDGADLTRLVFISPTEVMLRLANPQSPIVISLTDTVLNTTASTVVEKGPAPNP